MAKNIPLDKFNLIKTQLKSTFALRQHYRSFRALDIKYQIAIVIFVVALAVSLFAAYINRSSLNHILKNYKEVDTSYMQLFQINVEAEVLTDLPKPGVIKDKENPINGNLMTSEEYTNLLKRHPLAITVNNHSSARPQHGLSQADIVMEVLAEGGITRYVPIYYQNYDVEKIGPVRSVRYYMIEFASGFGDALLLHHGWAGFDDNPWENYTEQTDARGAIFKWDIKNIQTSPSTYRDLEKANRSGYVHSLYTDFSRINPEIERLSAAYNWELGGEVVEPLKFKFDDLPSERGNFSTVNVNFLDLSTQAYSSGFTYDKNTNTYLRSIAGQADIDLLVNEQIAPKNVVIEWHDFRYANDGHNRLIIEMVDSGPVTVLRDGKVLEGSWKKECRTCRTMYYNDANEEISLNRGQIWVVVAVKNGDNMISEVTYE